MCIKRFTINKTHFILFTVTNNFKLQEWTEIAKCHIFMFYIQVFQNSQETPKQIVCHALGKSMITQGIQNYELLIFLTVKII